ncbi:MAG TPA: hypothetical protein PLS53_10020 [Thermoanaerobaculaceae bacterium]|nr:hypothetical protein [Thermoanaerobaculaceae bacterium]HPS78479.1 hypothetical protein [Thermoanaerobaculaceae bacterium]
MTCEELRHRLDGEGTVDTPEARAHLAGCTDCARVVRGWAEVQAALRDMGQEPAPPFLHARIMAHLRSAETAPVRARGTFLHGWRVPAAAALGAAVVIVGLGLYQAVRPLTPPEPERPSTTAQAANPLAPGKQDLDQKVATHASASAPAESLKDERFASKQQETEKKSRQKGIDAVAASRVAVGTLASAPAPAAAAAPAPTSPAAEGGVRDLAAAGDMRRDRNEPAAQVIANGVLKAVSLPTQQGGLVRCRLRLEGDHQELNVELPADDAPAPDQEWLVTLHPDGRLELRDTQGQDRQAPLALQQGLSQQQAHTGRYRLSQAPLR